MISESDLVTHAGHFLRHYNSGVEGDCWCYASSAATQADAAQFIKVSDPCPTSLMASLPACLPACVNCMNNYLFICNVE